MNPKDEELFQRFQQDVKRIMRFFQEMENKFSAYRLYEMDKMNGRVCRWWEPFRYLLSQHSLY